MLAFFHDAFQSEAEPYPIIPTRYQYKGPFFLEYTEWLHLQNPFFGENFYNIQDSVNFTEIGFVDFADSRKDDGKYEMYVKIRNADGELETINAQKLLTPLDADLKDGHQFYNQRLFRQ